MEVSISDAQVEQAEAWVKGKIGGMVDSPFGFCCFYETVFDTELPEHAKDWIEFAYKSKDMDKGILIWSFRGSWKTSVLTIAFGAFRIGHEPHRANLIIQANDDSAAKTAGAIADIIEHNPGWRQCFPTIEPDKGKGWGMNGYEVKDTSIPYGMWRKKNASRKDPTLLGVGYKSSSAIGKHPDGFLSIDDIHDEENTSSARERQSVINRLTGTILPMVVEDETRKHGQRLITWELVVGTPWTEDDSYHYLRDTGEFNWMSTPVMIEAKEGDEGAVKITEEDMTVSTHTDILGWYKLKWAERFSKRIVVSWRNKSGKREFFRMYMLDLTSSHETGLKYFLFPNEKIDPRWVSGGGMDYASINKPSSVEQKGRNYMALAYGLKIPTGGAVIMDGVFEQCTQAQTEAHMEKAQGLFPNWQTTIVESDGRGDEFIQLASRHPHLRIMPMITKGKGKAERLERQLGPWLENGILRISDGNTPFLNALRKALDEYPNWHLDPIDAVYWYARSIPDVLQIKADEDKLATFGLKKRKENPYKILAGA